MKKIFLMAIGILPMIVHGQLTVISDDFESYTAGQPLAANSPLWTTWSGGISSEDANISNAESNSGANSIYVTGTTTDLVLPFPSDFSSGTYEMTMKVFTTTGHGAYWNYQASSTPGIAWQFEIYFDANGTGFINAGGTEAAAFEYNPETWTSFKIQVNLTSDQAEVWIDGNSIYTWQWSQGATGGGNIGTWGGMDIYAAAPPPTTAEFYIDDVVLTSLQACPAPTGLSVSSILATGAKLSWNAVGDAIGYKVFYHPAGSSSGIKKPSSTNSKTLKNLLPNTTYKWAVQSICSNNPLIASPFVTGPNFTTPPQRLSDETNAPVVIEIFPNPASENATISFSLSDPSPVVIRLFDINGKVIDEIENDIFSQGSHQVSFTSNAVAEGVYFLQLTTNKQVLTSKLVINH